MYFGDGGKHPIVQNYLASGDGRRHELLPYRLSSAKTSRLFALAFAMLRARTRDQASIVQAHDVVSGVLATLLWGRRTVFDSHEIYSCLARRKPIAWVVDRLERYVARRAGRVIYPSEERRDYFGELKGSRPVVIENLYRPTSLPLSSGDKVEIARLARIVEACTGPRYVYAGTMTEVRGIREIVQAFERPELRGRSLFLAGPRTKLLDSILAVGRENVVYLGEVPHAVMTALLPSFDVGFAIYKPSDANNRLAAPTKLFEYAYFGLEVIANRSAYVERVRDRCGLSNIVLIEEISSEGIARASRAVGCRTGTPREEWKESVVWGRQQPTIDAMYRDIERLSCT